MKSECPFCHAEIEVTGENAGTGTCPVCGKEFEVTEEILIEEAAGSGMLCECPDCGKMFEVGEKDIGSDTVCPFCGTDFTIFPAQQEIEVEEAAGTGFISNCPQCGIAFEVGAKDIGCETTCPDCGKVFIISAKKRGLSRRFILTAVMITVAVLVLAAAAAFAGYHVVPNQRRAVDNFAGFVVQYAEISSRADHTDAVVDAAKEETLKLLEKLQAKGQKDTFVKFYCDSRVIAYIEHICKIRKTAGYKPTPEDAQKEKDFFSYIHYRYEHSRRMLRNIESVTREVMKRFSEN